MSRYRRTAASAVLAFLSVLVVPGVAAAHNGHESLPDDLRAQITQLRDGSGQTAELPGITFAVAPGGIGLTVENTGPGVVEVTGEQAGEPLLRVTADKTWVNQASPQAKDVAGATVDPDAAAELIDLVWQRAPAEWVRLPNGGSAFVMDHRGVPGHPPAAGYQVGDVVGEFSIAFSLDGRPYSAAGSILAVSPPGGSTPWAPLLGGGLAVVALAGLGLWMSSKRGVPAPASLPRS